MNLDLKSINKCVRCGNCRSVCPVFEEESWESTNTRGRILVMKNLLNGLEIDSDVLNSLNTCTTCGFCTESCPAGVNPPDLIESARKELVNLGKMTKEQEGISRSISVSGNTFGEESDRLEWLCDRRLLRDKADYIYFVGCMNSYRFPNTAASTFNLLTRFGATILPNERCCGSPLIRMGFDPRRVINDNICQIEQIGAQTIIAGCAGCYTTLKKNYSNKFKVASVAEFIASHLSELRLEPLHITVTYHDPCHLGRHNRIFDQPREIIETFCNLKEMKTNQENARCCGGGGGVRAGYKDLSLKMARKRLREIPEGVDYIVTSCPLCIRNLRDAGAREKVIDLVDLVAKAIK